jgi:hypothetical protein
MAMTKTNMTFKSLPVEEAMALDPNVIHSGKVRLSHRMRGRSIFVFRRKPDGVWTRRGRLVSAEVAYLNGSVLDVTYKTDWLS